MQRFSLALLAVLATCAPVAQAENQIWTSLGLEKPWSEGSGLAFELDTELRYQPDGDLDTIEIRPGVSYELNDRLKVSGGYLFASSRRSGPDQREHRLWQQLSYDLFTIGEAEISGRSRLEESWREDADGTGYRLRQRVSLSHPVPGTELTFNLNNEAYIMLNETAWSPSGFLENRARATLDWEIDNGIEWSAGYLNQFRNRTGGAPDETNHHIYLGLSKAF